MDCLVTKLKAVVDNDNLPILRVLDPFTIAAIEKSGNSSMTDEQKFALNDFFISMGAVDNSSLWQKIDMMLLPIIGADGVANLLVDYTDNYLFNDNSYIINQDGKLAVSQNTILKVSNPGGTYKVKESGLLVAGSGFENIATSFSISAVGQGSAAAFYKVIKTVDNNTISYNYDYGNAHPSRRYNSNVFPDIHMIFTNNNVFGKGVLSNNEIVQTRTPIYGVFNDLPEDRQNVSSIALALYSQVDYTMIIDFNALVTDDEVTTVLEATTALKTAFSS